MVAAGLPGHGPCPVPTSVQGTEGQPRPADGGQAGAQNMCYGVKVGD